MSTINARKKPRGRPSVESEEIRARVQQPLLGRLDEYAAENDLPRAEAIRRLVEAGLERLA
ncbi:ribbon-helix-helix protein, CopG family [Novosphingobium sp. EMRT-2]|uniref:ribbon-helix-helix protein, CopG family n=1 Tax=Novosphingobium sp. EMRT-2 TaxID=2571749 RepID=UPI0010BDB584|nr:ribbon-helix-helix protein, CopG family [Novosphingobium sp. EMRT-2]